MSNLHQSVTVDDLSELLGLRSTNYLRNNSHIEIDQFSNAYQPFPFTTVPAPAHVCEELLNLHGIDFHENPLVIEIPKIPTWTIKPLLSTSIIVPPIQRVIHIYVNTVNTKRKDIALFADNIPKGVLMKDKNSRIIVEKYT